MGDVLGPKPQVTTDVGGGAENGKGSQEGLGVRAGDVSSL